MIGRKAEQILNQAVRYAMEQRHEYITLEHVLLSLLDDAEVANTLRACSANLDELRRQLEQYLEREVPKTERTDDGEGEGEGEHPVATLSIQRLVQRALFHVQSAGKDEIQPADFLVALFQAKDSQALYFLTKQGVERLDVLNYLSHGIRKDGDEAPANDDEPVGEDEPGDESGAQERGPQRRTVGNDPLHQYVTNLNTRAQAGKIDPLIGRANELERMVQTLCRRRKNNPLLVGEAGVGKTALAEGLAARVVAGDVPPLLEKAMVYSLDLGALLAGAKFRGDFEQRLKRVLAALRAKKEKGFMPVLFIDEIHTIIGAGAVSGGVLDAANLLKPLLTEGEIRVIGSTTYAEYRNIFEKDHALARRFQKIDVTEPTQDEAVQILNGLKSRFEDHHEVTYTPEAIRSAVELSAKHLTERFLPDKAIDVIDEAGAKARLARAKAAKEAGERTAGDDGAQVGTTSGDFKTAWAQARKPKVERSVIDQAFIEDIIAQIARIPPRSVSSNQKERLRNLDRDLKLSIFGQDAAVEQITTAIRLARSGLRSGDRPMGSFLFCGPTGVGKTELSKQLAHALGVPFLRFDMSEYSERHTVSRLIGAPPGYVGFEQNGLLTEAVLKSPHSVILLDEIEKAHPEVWNILLQVMDHGTLTDNNGRKADFRNAVILMTSNVGSRDMEKRALGLGADAGGAKESLSRAQRAVEQTFTPEFRNRLDAIVYFNPLDPITIGQVVGKQLMELESQLLAKKVEIEVDADVREWLAQKGYDRQMGARPMARLIQDTIKRPLSEEILFGKLEQGGTVHLSVRDGKIVFDFRPRGRGKDEPATIGAGGGPRGRGGDGDH